MTKYQYGIEWIALNDEPSEMNVAVIKNQISVLLLAFVFNCSAMKVACDVARARQLLGKPRLQD